jgi:hypothetical protein
MMDEKTFCKKYMQYYNEAQALIDKHDPCGTRKHKAAGICLEDIYYHGGKPKPTRCCSGCPHHDTKTGCQTNALSCKVWFCGAVHDSEQPGMDEFHEKIAALRKKIRENLSYIGIRNGMKEEWERYKYYNEKFEEPKNERRAAA